MSCAYRILNGLTSNIINLEVGARGVDHDGSYRRLLVSCSVGVDHRAHRLLFRQSLVVGRLREDWCVTVHVYYCDDQFAWKIKVIVVLSEICM